MIVQKENKQYRIGEEDFPRYAALGYAEVGGNVDPGADPAPDPDPNVDPGADPAPPKMGRKNKSGGESQ